MTSNRITEKMLESLCNDINDVTNTPEDQKYVVSYAYGGVQFQKKIASGGIYAITSGYTPKKELYIFMRSFLSGIYAGIELEKKNSDWMKDQLQDLGIPI